jgi:hypothetical protein
MGRFQESRAFIRKLCEALGIDPNRPIRRITIDAEINCVPVVTVQELATEGATGKLVELVRADPPTVVFEPFAADNPLSAT